MTGGEEWSIIKGCLKKREYSSWAKGESCIPFDVKRVKFGRFLEKRAEKIGVQYVYSMEEVEEMRWNK